MIIADIDPNNFIVDPAKLDEDRHWFDHYDKYYKLFTNFLMPTSIKVDVDLFHNEIVDYHHLFRQWGYNRPHLPRYGISLLNTDGNIRGKEDYGCAPLDTLPKELNLSEKDFNVKTEVFTNMNSMRVFDPIEKYLIRSNILLWHKHASFVPHIDTAPHMDYNLRLWGNTDPSGYVFDYVGNKCVDVEPGRIYLVDTTKFHTAIATKDWNYTFFMALHNSIFDSVESILI